MRTDWSSKAAQTAVVHCSCDSVCVYVAQCVCVFFCTFHFSGIFSVRFTFICSKVAPLQCLHACIVKLQEFLSCESFISVFFFFFCKSKEKMKKSILLLNVCRAFMHLLPSAAVVAVAGCYCYFSFKFLVAVDITFAFYSCCLPLFVY